MDTYINITDIKPTLNNNTIKVYQPQPQKTSIILMHVGNVSKVCDINMDTINIENKFTCHLVNKIYDIEYFPQIGTILSLVDRMLFLLTSIG